MSLQKRLKTSTSDGGMGTVGPTSCMNGAMSIGERTPLQLSEGPLAGITCERRGRGTE